MCAAKIMEGRRLEVRAVLNGHHDAGGGTYMMAFTASHHAGQRLVDTKRRISRTWTKMLAGDPWKRLRAAYGINGYIRALEVTWSPQNGWHPHVHVLFLTDGVLSDAEQAMLEWELFDRWDRIVQCEGAERPCNIDVFRLERATTPERAGDYIGKWGTDREITSLHVKRAKGGGFSPWDLLDLIGRGGDRARRLFREFSKAMKGSRQLTWSRGLKARYGIDEVADEALSEEVADAEAVAVADLAGDDFDIVYAAGRVCDVLEVLERDGVEAFYRAVDEIATPKRRHQLKFRRRRRDLVIGRIRELKQRRAQRQSQAVMERSERDGERVFGERHGAVERCAGIGACHGQGVVVVVGAD